MASLNPFASNPARMNAGASSFVFASCVYVPE
jgi:hypothetical protein